MGVRNTESRNGQVHGREKMSVGLWGSTYGNSPRMVKVSRLSIGLEDTYFCSVTGLLVNERKFRLPFSLDIS